MAITLPLALLTSGLWSVAQYADSKEFDAQRNAGQVLNGERLETSTADAIADRMAKRRPDIVVVGDSIANNAIAGKRLAEQLDMSPDDVLMLTIPGTISAHWYALLKHHVFAEDHKPTLVVVVSSLQSMLEPVPTSTAMKANLDALVTREDAVVRKKAYPTLLSRLAWHRLRTTKQDLRRDLLYQARGLWVGLLWNNSDAQVSRWKQGQTNAHKAHDRVFANEKMDFSTLNIQATGVPRTNPASKRLAPPEEGFLPNLARLVASHDAKLLMVRAPLSPLIEPEQADVVPDRWTERSRSVLAQHNARLLDLGNMEVGVKAYRDPLHMTKRGKQRFTDVVAHYIAGVRGQVRGADWWSERFEPRQPLDDDRLTGGQTTTLEFDRLWPGEGRRFRVQAKLSTKTEKGEAPPTIYTEQGSIKAKRYPNAWMFDGWLPLPTTTPWTLTVQHPTSSDSALEALTFGDVGHVSYVYGDSVRFKGPSLDLLAPGTARAVVASTERPNRPLLFPVLEAAPQNMGMFSVPGFADIFDQRSLSAHNATTQCAPVQVLENGQALGARQSTCARLRHERPGQSCFDGDRVYFTSTDRRPPSTNDSQYTAVLHPERSCGEAWWVYPGDTLTFTVGPDATTAWKQRTRKLGISSLTTGTDGTLEVSVVSDSGTHLETNVEPMPETTRAGFVRRLASSQEGEELRIILHNPTEDLYFLVDHLALRP